MYVAVERSLLLNTISNALVHESLCSSVFSQYLLIDRNLSQGHIRIYYCYCGAAGIN